MTQKAVRKWVEGEGLPETVRLMQIARDFGCHFEWLATGRGPRDIGPSAGHAQAELLRRYEAAHDDTKKLIELALYEGDEEATRQLSPSLLAMVRMIKTAIAAQGDAS